MSETTTPEPAQPDGELVVPAEDAPPAPALPVDAAGNPAAPWDEEVFLRDQKRAAAKQAWERMVANEAQARTIDATGAATITMQGPNGQPVQDSAVLPEGERADAAADVQKEADRQRRVAMALISHSGLDELTLIAERIRTLNLRLDQNKRELAVHKDFRDHPDHYGWVMMDGQTPIDHEREVTAVTVLETQMADAEAELAYYAAQG